MKNDGEDPLQQRVRSRWLRRCRNLQKRISPVLTTRGPGNAAGKPHVAQRLSDPWAKASHVQKINFLHLAPSHPHSHASALFLELQQLPLLQRSLCPVGISPAAAPGAGPAASLLLSRWEAGERLTSTMREGLWISLFSTSVVGKMPVRRTGWVRPQEHEGAPGPA